MTKNFGEEVKILGVKVNKISFKKTVEKISQWLKINGQGKRYLVTPNPEIIIYAQKDSEFREILNKADLAIPDGTGILWAIKMLNKQISKYANITNKQIKERVTGMDLMIKLCELAPKFEWKIGLIGGYDETAKKTAEKLRSMFPGINIVFAENGGEIDKYGSPLSRYPDNPKREMDILFVAFGFPKQEYWIDKNLKTFPAKVFIPVGGAFDYISGKVKRAPLWLQKFGLEWLYRLIKEPRRIKRQLFGAKFFFLVLKEKIK